MTKTVESAILTVTSARAYRHRLARINKCVGDMGWGTKAKIARGTDLAPSTISNVLNGRMLSSMHLDRIEQYLIEQGGE